ncbi:MAG TPA: alpha/beta fold hydrolase [Anaerolineales bacterium]
MKLRRFLIIIGSGIAIIVLLLLISYRMTDQEKITLSDTVRLALPGQFVKLPLGVVHYELAGPDNAPTVVLVHGFSVPYYIWDPTFEALTQAGFRVLRYDLYGRGFSDRPEKNYDLDLFVTQLEELLPALNIQGPVDLVGLSMGGPIVASFANHHPDQVRSLILIDPEVAPVSTQRIFPLNIPLVGEYLMTVYVAPVELPKTQTDDFYRPDRFPDWEAMYRVQLQYKGFRRAILSTIRAQPGMDSLAEFGAVGQQNLPALLIWGREDKTVSSADMQQLVKLIPGIEYHIIEEAGHIPQYERPEVVNPLLVEFLNGLKVPSVP